MTSRSSWESALTQSWKNMQMGRSVRGNPWWVEQLVNLGPDLATGVELAGAPLIGPPSESTWDFTAGHDVRGAREQRSEDVLERFLLEYGWLRADVEAAATLTALRGRDLARAWVSITGGHRLGGLASIAIARALFETGLEAFRVAATVRDSLATAPLEEGTLIGFSDGIWVPLFRYLGGEKTPVVSPRETTRNTLSNVKWLRSAEATQVLADDYDLASHVLHSSGRELSTKSSRLPEQAEMALLATGASGTVQAFQFFRNAAHAVQLIAAHATSTEQVQTVAMIGFDANISRLPETPTL